MTTITELNLMRNMPQGTTDQVLAVLTREAKPMTMQDLIAVGAVSKTHAPNALLLLIHRGDVVAQTIGDPKTVVSKVYQAASATPPKKTRKKRAR